MGAIVFIICLMTVLCLIPVYTSESRSQVERQITQTTTRPPLTTQSFIQPPTTNVIVTEAPTPFNFNVNPSPNLNTNPNVNSNSNLSPNPNLIPSSNPNQIDRMFDQEANSRFQPGFNIQPQPQPQPTVLRPNDATTPPSIIPFQISNN